MVPVKVTCFIGRASLGRIPSAMALKSRGIPIGSDVCGYCNEAVEDSDHILVRCHIAIITRKWILQWCEISDRHFAHLCELLDFVVSWGTALRNGNYFWPYVMACFGGYGKLEI